MKKECKHRFEPRLERLKIDSCPVCGGDRVQIYYQTRIANHYQMGMGIGLQCKCGAKTDVYTSLEDSISAWNMGEVEE